MTPLLLFAFAGLFAPAATDDGAAPAASGIDLAGLRALYLELDCERLLVAAPAVREAPGLSPAEQLELSFLEASCSVVVGNIGDAARTLRALVLSDLSVQPPFAVEERVELLLEAERVRERRRQDEEAERLRQARYAAVRLNVRPVGTVAGGARMTLVVGVTDPDDIVRAVRVDFRRKGTLEFYSLPLERRDDDQWVGEIPGRYTRTSGGMVLEWFLTASAADGGFIRRVGSEESPLKQVIEPGEEVATDLRANERFPQRIRLLFGFFGTASAASLPLFVAAAAAVFLPPGAPDGFGLDQSEVRKYAVVGITGLGVAATVAATATATFWLLDDWPRYLAPVLVGAIGAVGVALLMASPPAAVNSLDGPPMVGGVAGLLAGTAAVLTTVPAILLDPPTE
jgi:hypothetical protein